MNFTIGWYLYIEVTSRKNGEVARISSPPIKTFGESCVRFWSHMWGSNIGKLDVLISSNTSEILWSKSGTQGDEWLINEIDVNSTTEYNVRISIETSALRSKF